MKQISSDYLRQIINEAVNETFSEAGAPTPLGGHKPLGGPTPLNAPKPLNGPTPLGGPKPLGSPTPLGGPKPVSGQQAQAIPQASGSDDSVTFSGKKTNNGFWPGVSSCKYENFYETSDPNEQDQQVLKIDIDFIHNVTAQRWINELNQKFSNIIYVTKIQKPWLAKKVKSKAEQDEVKNFLYLVRIIVRPGKNTDFVNIADTIIDTLYKMPQVNNKMTGFSVKYDPSFEDEFITRIRDMVKKTPTAQEIEEVNMKIADNWTELLANMKDPAIQQKLGNISGIIASSVSAAQARADVKGDNGFDAGHQLSFRNKMQIFAQDPNATFVTQEFQWRKWGHEVIDPNKFIIITHPSRKKVDVNDKDAGAKRSGFAGGNDEFKMRKKRGELQGGEIHAVKMNTQYASSDDVFFYPIKVYDVANTRVIPGAKSKFLDGPDQERNLSNNILGIPNAAAKAAGVATDASGAAQIPVSTTNDGTNNPQVQEIRDSLVAIVKSKVQASTPQETGNAERDIVNYAYAYANFLLKTAFQGISKPETQEAFSQGFTAAVAIAVGIQDDAAANYLSKALQNRGKDSTLKQLIVQWFDEYTDLMEWVYKDVVKKMKVNKAKAPAKKVVEEDGLGMSAAPQIKPVSFGEFEELCGVEEDGQSMYEEQDDYVGDNAIKESFFALLDRIEEHDRF